MDTTHNITVPSSGLKVKILSWFKSTKLSKQSTHSDFYPSSSSEVTLLRRSRISSSFRTSNSSRPLSTDISFLTSSVPEFRRSVSSERCKSANANSRTDLDFNCQQMHMRFPLSECQRSRSCEYGVEADCSRLLHANFDKRCRQQIRGKTFDQRASHLLKKNDSMANKENVSPLLERKSILKSSISSSGCLSERPSSSSSNEKSSISQKVKGHITFEDQQPFLPRSSTVTVLGGTALPPTISQSSIDSDKNFSKKSLNRKYIVDGVAELSRVQQVHPFVDGDRKQSKNQEPLNAKIFPKSKAQYSLDRAIDGTMNKKCLCTGIAVQQQSKPNIFGTPTIKTLCSECQVQMKHKTARAVRTRILTERTKRKNILHYVQSDSSASQLLLNRWVRLKNEQEQTAVLADDECSVISSIGIGNVMKTGFPRKPTVSHQKTCGKQKSNSGNKQQTISCDRQIPVLSRVGIQDFCKASKVPAHSGPVYANISDFNNANGLKNSTCFEEKLSSTGINSRDKCHDTSCTMTRMSSSQVPVADLKHFHMKSGKLCVEGEASKMAINAHVNQPVCNGSGIEETTRTSNSCVKQPLLQKSNFISASSESDNGSNCESTKKSSIQHETIFPDTKCKRSYDSIVTSNSDLKNGIDHQSNGPTPKSPDLKNKLFAWYENIEDDVLQSLQSISAEHIPRSCFGRSINSTSFDSPTLNKSTLSHLVEKAVKKSLDHLLAANALPVLQSPLKISQSLDDLRSDCKERSLNETLCKNMGYLLDKESATDVRKNDPTHEPLYGNLWDFCSGKFGSAPDLTKSANSLVEGLRRPISLDCLSPSKKSLNFYEMFREAMQKGLDHVDLKESLGSRSNLRAGQDISSDGLDSTPPKNNSTIGSENSELIDELIRLGKGIPSKSGFVKRTPTKKMKYKAKDVLTGKAKLKLTVYKTGSLLTVNVMKAASLSSTRCHIVNCYVKVSLHPDELKRTNWRTNVAKSSNNPAFNQLFSFELLPEDKEKRLMISVWHRDIINRRSEFLGCMTFGIHHIIDETQCIQGWYRLLNETVGTKKHFAARSICRKQ